MTGVIGIGGATVIRTDGPWHDGQLAHGIMATIGVLAMVLTAIQLVFISINRGVFKNSPRKYYHIY